MAKDTVICTLRFALWIQHFENKADFINYLNLIHAYGINISADKNTYCTITCALIYGNERIEDGDEAFTAWLDNPFSVSYYNRVKGAAEKVRLNDKKYNKKPLPIGPQHHIQVGVTTTTSSSDFEYFDEGLKYEFVIEWDGTDGTEISVVHTIGAPDPNPTKVTNYEKRTLTTFSKYDYEP